MGDFQTSNGPFSELREPILMIFGAKWQRPRVFLEKQHEKTFIEIRPSFSGENCFFDSKLALIRLSRTQL